MKCDNTKCENTNSAPDGAEELESFKENGLMQKSYEEQEGYYTKSERPEQERRNKNKNVKIKMHGELHLIMSYS